MSISDLFGILKGKFMNPLPKGTTNFHGDMDSYRAAVNANMSVIAETPEEEIRKHIDEKDILMRENAELKVALETSRQAMLNHLSKSRSKEEVYEERIKYLEMQLKGMRVISKDNGDYDAEMKGMVL